MQSPQTVFLPHYIVQWQNASSTMYRTRNVTLSIVISSYHTHHRVLRVLLKLYEYLHLKNSGRFKLSVIQCINYVVHDCKDYGCIESCANNWFETNIDSALKLLILEP